MVFIDKRYILIHRKFRAAVLSDVKNHRVVLNGELFLQLITLHKSTGHSYCKYRYYSITQQLPAGVGIFAAG